MNRWFRLASAAVAMIMIANFQYAWTLFVKPLISGHAAQHWKLSDVGLAFSIFVVCQTWLMPVSGWLIDKIGPRFMMTLGGLLCGGGWAMMSQAGSLFKRSTPSMPQQEWAQCWSIADRWAWRSNGFPISVAWPPA